MDYNELFEYRDGHIYNKVRRGTTGLIGKEAGTKRKDGYRQVKVNGKYKQSHIVIWEMHNGKVPKGLELDHINRNRGDDRIENLRAVTRSVNQHNKGGLGVCIDKRAKARPYMAYIKNNQKHKTIGAYGTLCGALMARMMYKLKLITLA